MLIELPNGDWVDPKVIQGVRVTDDKSYGPRVAIDAYGQSSHYFFHMDSEEAARGWAKEFAARCNEYLRQKA